MTGRDHVNLACLARNESRAEAFERADGLALTPWLDEQARTLSSGNVKKLWYLICTLGAASLFVLDEPFDAVDQEGVEQMCLDITRWSTSALVILTSHHLPAQVADARQLLISSFAPSDHDSETVAQ
jgi:ABC-type multidrug transport system ATPase subunit